MRVVIVGGVAGGAATATRLRRLNEECEIVMYERGEYISFANCGLPYYIGGVIKDREGIIVVTEKEMRKKYNIDVKTKHEVVSIDRENKRVKVKNLNTGEEFEDSYDFLVLSPGANPAKPPIPGIDSDKIFTLRTIPDADRIIAEIEKGSKEVVVVGGGFIGIEVAENLKLRGLNVHVVEMLPQVLSFLDREMAEFVHEELISNGINLHLGSAVKEFRDKGDRIDVILENGKTVSGDFVVFAIGVKPEVNLARDAGLSIGKFGGIEVNERMQTSDPDIYAVGDAVEIPHCVVDMNVRIALAGPATKEARIAADNICGINSKYDCAMGTCVVKVFEISAGSCGLNSHLLKKSGIKYDSLYVWGFGHASYYPDAKPLYIKVLYSPEDKRILGAQVVGYEGVDKRVDVLATAMKFGANLVDVKDLNLSYAPPFGSSKDLVNYVGFVAENIFRGLSPSISPYEVDDYIKKGAIPLDVRNREELATGKIEGSINIPLPELRERLNELDKNKTYLTYCKAGLRGYIAQRILIGNGFKALNIRGGYDLYRSFNRDRFGV
ncbi:MAG: CoA-disulfide reductase [Caldiserica bacterium]|nr:MAG: CoA-disulfide reductase [Caldisericota bacterium]